MPRHTPPLGRLLACATGGVALAATLSLSALNAADAATPGSEQVSGGQSSAFDAARPTQPGVSAAPCTHAEAGHIACLSESAGTITAPTPPAGSADTDARPQVATGWNPPFYAADLQEFYGTQAAAGSPTVAIVNVGHDPATYSDLAYYRSYNHLPDCTIANGCLTETDQNGSTASTSLPAEVSSWDEETMLDLDTVSGVCPGCKILLVDAASTSLTDATTATATAVRLGAKYVSMSWGALDWTDHSSLNQTFTTPGTTFVAASGDDGSAIGSAQWPSTAPGVISVGGVSANHVANTGTRADWALSAWSGTDGGCSWYTQAPAAQASVAAISSICRGYRGATDISGLADPLTGVAVWTGGQWHLIGGTSAAAPAITAMYALEGNSTNPEAFYSNPNHSLLSDVMSGHADYCGNPADTTCIAGAGWDGPTGFGVPYTPAALSPVANPAALVPASSGDRTAKAGTPVSWRIAPGGASGVTYSYSLPAGLNGSPEGLITGAIATAGTYSATVTLTPAANDLAHTATTLSFHITVNGPLGSLSAKGWIPLAPIRPGATARVQMSKVAIRVTAKPGAKTKKAKKSTSTITWYLDGKQVAHGTKVKVKKSWTGHRLWYRVRVTAKNCRPTTHTSNKVRIA